MAEEKDIKLGTAADDPVAHLAPPDMNRYYYPPGTTEPVLRPEFANETAAEPKAEEAQPAKAATKTARKK